MAADLTGRAPEPQPERTVLLLPAAGVAAGLGGVLTAWWGASAQLVAAAQLPWLVSGGLGGLALLALSVTLGGVTLRRRAVAREVVALDHALAAVRRMSVRR